MGEVACMTKGRSTAAPEVNVIIQAHALLASAGSNRIL